jgi:hypothetical protein
MISFKRQPDAKIGSGVYDADVITIEGPFVLLLASVEPSTFVPAAVS